MSMPKPGDAVFAKGWRGIAFHFDAYRQEVFVPEDELGVNGTWQDVPVKGWKNYEDFEVRDDLTRAVCHMIGDDLSHTFDIDELTVLPREEYCGVCGQIGCRHDGYDRSDNA